MMGKRLELTEDQRWTITTGLRIAAEKYRENAVYLRSRVPEHIRLAEQFERQTKDALELAEKLENAEYIALGPEYKEVTP